MKGIYGSRKRTVSFEVRERVPVGGEEAGDIPAAGGREEAGGDIGEEAGVEFIEPTSAGGKTFDIGGEAGGEKGNSETGGEKIRNKGGRPKGWRKNPNSQTRAKKVSTTLEGLETLLHTIHLSLSLATKIPELCLTKEEADAQARAYARVASLYDVGATEEMLAWAGLLTVLGAQYGTRYLAYSIRTKNEAAAKPKPFLVNQQ